MPHKKLVKTGGLAEGKVEEGKQPARHDSESKDSKTENPASQESSQSGPHTKDSKKHQDDPHAAATKAYSPFLNKVFGKVSEGLKSRNMQLSVNLTRLCGRLRVPNRTVKVLLGGTSVCIIGKIDDSSLCKV